MLLSWGVVGRQTVALIAEKHLTPKAKAGIQSLLGNTSLSEISSWADEMRYEPEYKKTDPWHYISLPLGLSRSDFDLQVRNMTKANVYKALIDQEHQLLRVPPPKSKKLRV